VPELLSDAEQRSLVERLRSGDRHAEDDLVRVFHGRLLMMFTARLHDREAARDLAQDALIACVTSLRAGQLRNDERLAAFVYGVARNLVNNYHRRRQGAPVEVPLDPATFGAPATDALEDDEKRAIAERAIGSLEAADREILTLTLVEGLKSGAIAARLRLSSDVVRARKSRALKKVTAEVQRLSQFRRDRH
jgi:RNA polymerase sigma-70 factor (ECF subfamily)